MTRRLTILVVEDDAELRDVYREVLTDEGHEVRAASDGSEALKMLRGPLDLIITDLNMPRMSGVEFLRELRNAGQLAKLPVLVVTAFPEDLPTSLRDPRIAVLRKPFRLQAFGDYVGAIANGVPAPAAPADQ